jgi:RNA polymerase sigma factor (sigma-70 family)
VRLAGLLVGDYGLGEEIAQEAFACVLEARSDITNPDRYLRAVVANLCRSWVRRAVLARRHGDRATDSASNLAGPEEASERDAARSEVRRALMRLPRRQREAVVLRFYGEMTEGDIAAVMGVSVGSVKTHLHRATTALSEHLEDLR